MHFTFMVSTSVTELGVRDFKIKIIFWDVYNDIKYNKTNHG